MSEPSGPAVMYRMAKTLIQALKNMMKVYQNSQTDENIQKWLLQQTAQEKALKKLPPKHFIAMRNQFDERKADPDRLQHRKNSYNYKQRIVALRNLEQNVLNQPDVPFDNIGFNKDSRKHLSPFFLFLQEKREAFHNQYPQLSNKQLSKTLADVWKSLSEEQKKPFYQQSVTHREQFDKTFKTYFDEMVKIQKKLKKKNRYKLQNE